MGNIDKRLAELGIEVPTPAAPVASYVPAVEVNGMLHISGQVSMQDGKLITGQNPPSSEGTAKAVMQALQQG